MKKHAYTLALAALLSACGGGQPDTAGSAENAEVPAANEAEPTPQPTVALGQAGVGRGFEFTVRSVEQRASVGSSTRAAAGETLVVVRYDFKNTSDEPVSRGGRPEMKLVDPQGRSYADDGAAGLSLTGLGDATSDTNPGTTARVSAVWRVDKAAFDAGGWTLVLATEPPLTFAFK